MEEKIIIGSDHAAYPLKEKIKAFIERQGIEALDLGVYDDNKSSDYPQIGIKAASMISEGKYEKGILLCGTGIGMSMVANRFPRVRAALCLDMFSAFMSRRHNDSNILVMGGRVIGDALAVEITDIWLKTTFEGGRHIRRIQMFDEITVK